jgi:ribosome maturation factor RimP
VVSLEAIRPQIEEKLSALGYELYDMKFFHAGKRSVLRIYIDALGGVGVDDCEKASREISVLLDVENVIQKSYTLEVSSPGADRPLRSRKDFRRAVGHDVTLTLHGEIEGRNTIAGLVRAAREDAVNLDSGAGVVSIPYDTIKTGKIEIKFK